LLTLAGQRFAVDHIVQLPAVFDLLGKAKAANRLIADERFLLVQRKRADCRMSKASQSFDLQMQAVTANR
jgi:hypothetical protein